MPRFTMSHDKVVRVIFALLADSTRRHDIIKQGDANAIMHAEVCEENDRIVNHLNRVRARDGLPPATYNYRAR